MIDLNWSDIKIGDSTSFKQVWTEQDVDTFAKVSGDTNPLHMDIDYAANTIFKKRVVHGMLVASSFSKLVGTQLPGKKCLYIKQTINFRKPVFIGDTLEIFGKISTKSESTRLLDILVRIEKDGEIMVDGLATVKLLD